MEDAPTYEELEQRIKELWVQLVSFVVKWKAVN